jgi:membrane dipeptidase
MVPTFSRVAVCTLFLVEAAAQITAQTPSVRNARTVHDRVITLDSHVDINTENFTPRRNYTQRLPIQVDLPKMQAGGLDAAFFVVQVPQRALTAQGYDRAYTAAVEKFDAIHRLTTTLAPNQIGLALTPEDVRRIIGQGKRVALIGVENGYPIGEDIRRVREFYDRGARYLSLAHDGHNQLSDSNTGERDGVWRHNGLSALGRQVIAELNKWGVMVDLSHASKRAAMQTLEISKAPVIASHSAVRTLCDHARNMDDELLLALKKNGGVIQIIAYSPFLCARSRGTASVKDLVDHIDYAVKQIGVDHVGIASDFDGGGGIAGWKDAGETFNVTLELIRRGYTEDQIVKLWGGNLLRVMQQVQQIARALQTR